MRPTDPSLTGASKPISASLIAPGEASKVEDSPNGRLRDIKTGAVASGR